MMRLRCIGVRIDCSSRSERSASRLPQPHSIQNAKVLELIQTDGHVLMPDFRLVNGDMAQARKPVNWRLRRRQ
jgi:hypothetical protein